VTTPAQQIRPSQTPPGRRSVVLVGFLSGLAAGTLWGTTGPLSTALYAEGSQLTDVGFWRVLLAVIGFAVYGVIAYRDLFRVDRTALVYVLLIGGCLVAVFEVAFQYAIAGVGVASAVALLYTAPVIVAILARPLLGESLTPARILMALIVMAGVYLTVNGSHIEGTIDEAASATGRTAGIIGGLLAACSFAGSTLLARFAVPIYGSRRVLFLELVGGTLILGLVLPLTGHAPQPPPTQAGWLYIMALGAGAVLAANFFFFAAARRIDAAPTAIAASIEPVVGALLALILFGQTLILSGWTGLFMVVGGVAGGYALEARRVARARSAGPASA
jgi:drug/metabolite transporter (DMT)-like permease